MAQANALIPWLTEVFTEVRADVDELLALRAQSRLRRGLAAQGLDSAVEDGRIQRLEQRIRHLVEEVGALGLEVRRVDGMVDIPSWRQGDIVFLCWRLGEDRIRHWHAVQGGWPDRRPLEQEELDGRLEMN